MRNKNGNVRGFCTFAAVSLLAFVSPVIAAIKSGNLQIIPSIGIGGMQDSNIYLDSNSVKSSLITNIRPALGFFLPVNKHEFKLDYFADILNYAEKPSNNNTINHNLSFLSKLSFPSGFSLSAGDNYNNTTDPLTTELVERIKRTQNNILASASYKFSQALNLSINYSQEAHNYSQQEYRSALDRKESETNMEIASFISPKLLVILDYGKGTVSYLDSSNINSSKSTQFHAGLRGNLTPKTAGELKFGSKEKKFDTVTGKNITSSVFSLSSLTDFSKNTRIALYGGRNIVESTFYTNLYFTENVFTVRLFQKVHGRWSASLGGGYGAHYYPEEVTIGAVTQKRQDNNVDASAEISYEAFKYLSLSGGYTTKQRDSNFDQYDHTDRIIKLYTKLVF